MGDTESGPSHCLAGCDRDFAASLTERALTRDGIKPPTVFSARDLQAARKAGANRCSALNNDPPRF